MWEKEQDFKPRVQTKINISIPLSECLIKTYGKNSYR